MNKDQIVKLIVDNNLTVEIYNDLHNIVMTELGSLQNKSEELNSELRLIKKFADANKLKPIKAILAESTECL